MNLDPVEFRRINILREGRPQATGTDMKDAAIDLVLTRRKEDQAREAYELDQKKKRLALDQIPQDGV